MLHHRPLTTARIAATACLSILSLIPGRVAHAMAALAATDNAAAGLLLSTIAPPPTAANPLEEGLVARDGFELHYRVVGSTGPYLVILSGGPGSDVHYMQPIADELSKTYRCVMLEQRGTGRSKLATYDTLTINWHVYIEDIEALRLKLKTDRLVLVGNSWGMLLALLYGAAQPAHVSAIVTLGSGPITTANAGVFNRNIWQKLSPTEMQAILYWSAPGHMAEDSQRAHCECVRAAMPGYFYDRALALDYAAGMHEADSNSRVLPAFEGDMISYDLRPQLRTITAPVLLLQGHQDCAGEANVNEAHLLIKSSTLTYLDHCGHLPWAEQPASMWRAVHAFLDAVPAGG